MSEKSKAVGVSLIERFSINFSFISGKELAALNKW